MDIVVSTNPYTDYNAYCKGLAQFPVISESHDDKANGLSTAMSDNYLVFTWSSKHNATWNGVGAYGDTFLKTEKMRS